jgi:hypothetical protein
MTGTDVIPSVLLAVMLASVAPAIADHNADVQAGRAQATAGGSASGLTAEIPGTIRRGEAVTLVLHVSKEGRPVDGAAACLAAVPLFISIEDALDSTPAGGADLGAGSAPGAQPACTTSIAGLPRGRGAYEFTWEPDTPGRVNLTFTAAGLTLTKAVDVGSAPPDTATLASFVLLVVFIFCAAAFLRRRVRSKSAAS